MMNYKKGVVVFEHLHIQLYIQGVSYFCSPLHIFQTAMIVKGGALPLRSCKKQNKKTATTKNKTTLTYAV